MRSKPMSEIIFIVENSDEGGYTAKSLDYSIYTEGETLDELKENVKDAVKCHFDPKEVPRIVRLHIVKDEVIAI
jgi:predicted RNase H-like HicB family nuclease